MRIQEEKNKNEERRGETSFLSRSTGAGFSLHRLCRLWPGVIRLWEKLVRLGQRSPKRLRLCESLPLGERRFVAVVEFDTERFLVGGTASSMVLLSRLAEGEAHDKERDKAAQNLESTVGENGLVRRW